MIFVLPLIIIALWLPDFRDHFVQLFPFDLYAGPLYELVGSFSTRNILFSKITALLLYFLIAILLVRLNIKYFFIQSRTQLPAVIYLLIISGIIIIQRFNPVILSSLLLIIATDRIFESFKFDGLAYHYFDAALLISLSSLIYINSFYFIAFLWVGLVLLRQFRWREWSFTIIGLILPYLFLYGYYLATGKDIHEMLFKTIREYFSDGFAITYRVFQVKLFGYILLAYILLASVFMMQLFDTKKTHSRKYFLFFLWMFIISTLMFILIPSYGVEYLIIAAIPVSYLLSHYFAFSRLNWINRIIFTVFLLIPFIVVYFDDFSVWFK